jgi:hypothetical protein
LQGCRPFEPVAHAASQRLIRRVPHAPASPSTGTFPERALERDRSPYESQEPRPSQVCESPQPFHRHSFLEPQSASCVHFVFSGFASCIVSVYLPYYSTRTRYRESRTSFVSVLPNIQSILSINSSRFTTRQSTCALPLPPFSSSPPLPPSPAHHHRVISCNLHMPPNR